MNVNKRLKPKSQNNYFKEKFLADPNFNERVENEMYFHISRMAKRNMPANDSRTLDETIQDRVEQQDLNVDFLYNLIQESYFKINDSRKKNKFQKDDKILKSLNIKFFNILENSPDHNKDELEDVFKKRNSSTF